MPLSRLFDFDLQTLKNKYLTLYQFTTRNKPWLNAAGRQLLLLTLPNTKLAYPIIIYYPKS